MNRNCPSCRCDLSAEWFEANDPQGRCVLCMPLTEQETFTIHRLWVAGDLTTYMPAATCYHCWHELQAGTLTCCRCGAEDAGEKAA